MSAHVAAHMDLGVAPATGWLAELPPATCVGKFGVIIISSTGIGSLASQKKAPLNAGLELRGRGLAYPALFGRFSFETNVFGYTLFGGASLFRPADYCERGKCVPAVFGVGVAPDEEPRSGSSSSAHESTSGRSTNYGSGHPIRVFRDIGRIVS